LIHSYRIPNCTTPRRCSTQLAIMAHSFYIIICIQIIRNNRNSSMQSCMVSAKKACYRPIPYISLRLEEINFLGASFEVAARPGHRPLRTNTYSQISIHANNIVVSCVKTAAHGTTLTFCTAVRRRHSFPTTTCISPLS